MATHNPIRAVLSVLVLLTFLGVITACYGPFNLTRTIYKWNGQIKGTGEVNAKWMRELVFLGLVLLPVYEFSLIIDGLLLNSVEFWGGENPIKASDRDTDGNIRVVHLGQTAIMMTHDQSRQAAQVTYAEAGRVLRTATIAETAEGYRLLDENGRVLASAEFLADGGLKFLNANCELVGSLSKVRLQEAAKQLTVSSRETT